MEGFDLKKAIRILRSKKISSNDIAATLGITREHLSRIINGKKPFTPTLKDIFLLEYGPSIEGVELVEISDEKTVAIQIGLEAKVEVLTEIVLGLVSSFGEVSSNISGRGLQTFIDKGTEELLRNFDERVEEASERILKIRGSS